VEGDVVDGYQVTMLSAGTHVVTAKDSEQNIIGQTSVTVVPSDADHLVLQAVDPAVALVDSWVGFSPAVLDVEGNMIGDTAADTVLVSSNPADVIDNAGLRVQLAGGPGDRTVTAVYKQGTPDELVSAPMTLTAIAPDADASVLREVLADQLQTVDEMDPADYSETSWSRVLQAKKSAEDALKGSPSVADLKTAVTVLADAVAALEPAPVVEKGAASNAVAKADGLNSSAYTPDSWASLQTALATARSVLADKDAKQADVDQALSSVVNAMAALQAIPVVKEIPGQTVVVGTEVHVTKVKLSQSQLTLVKGKRFTMPAGVYFSEGYASYWDALTWKSSNAKVATVNQNGAVTAKKAGTVTITATVKQADAKGKRPSVQIKVKVVAKKPKTKVSKVWANVPKTLKVGQSVYVTGKYSSAKAASVKVSYSTSKYQVAVIDKAGRIVGKSKGTDTITVKAGKKSKKYKITVK
jgi:hypothetical protein